MILGGLVDGYWSAERPSCDETLGTFSPIPYPTERGEGLEMELIIDYAYMMKPPQKAKKNVGFRELPVVRTHPHT